MIIKILFTVIFLAVMIGVGLYTRKQASSVEGFVLGGRAVGPWLTAFAFGTSYFSAVVFVGYAGQFGWKFGVASTWVGIGNAVIGSLLAWAVLGRRTRIMTQRCLISLAPALTIRACVWQHQSSPLYSLFPIPLVYIAAFRACSRWDSAFLTSIAW